jgi:hypothetical protein
MNISGAFARMDAPHPLDALRALVTDSASMIEFRNMCEYLHKITRKDLDQIRRFAKEVTGCWEADSTYDQFFSRRHARDRRRGGSAPVAVGMAHAEPGPPRVAPESSVVGSW